MSERQHALSFGTISRKIVFCLFPFVSALFFFSWFSLLRSTSRPSIVDHSWLSNPKLLSTIDNGNSQSFHQNDVAPPIGNQGNRFDNVREGDEEEEQDRGKKQEEAYVENGKSNTCDKSSKEPIKVFMHDLPPEFHFKLLDWKAQGNNIWPDVRSKLPEYPGGLTLQHSIEYWLTLDLLASEAPDISRARSAFRVRNSSEADLIFVPFFSSLSYNRYSKVNPHQKKSKDRLLQEKLVKFVTSQPEWKRSGGRDHIILAHHPNSMLFARMILWPAMFILSDFGRYPPTIANVDKDVIAPYKHMIRSYIDDSSDFNSRPTLLFFQGAIYRKDVCVLSLN
uniref:Uncharacterized protein MANES_08G151400 n=1 Tax=Rhizophora mucronata TaxID=61149 RepID=A0A2P2JTK5_RHIMU